MCFTITFKFLHVFIHTSFEEKNIHFFLVLIDNLHQILFSDDPNGIQLNIPNGVDNDISHAKKVLTPEMVNLGIKVQYKYIFAKTVLICLCFCPD